MRVLFLANDAGFVRSHWLGVLTRLRAAGVSIEIGAPAGPKLDELREAGWTCHPISLARHSLNLLGELRLIWQMGGLVRRANPDMVHLVTIKPVLWGGLICRFCGKPRVCYISGIGYTALAPGLAGWVLRTLVRLLYPLSLGGHRARIVVENPTDKAVLQGFGIKTAGRCHQIAGAGVDLSRFVIVPEPATTVTAVMPARLLRDKGAVEYVAAARILAVRRIPVRLVHAGATDPSYPNSVTPEALAAWQAEGTVRFLGQRDDMPAVLAASHIAVLPSYREGLPLALAEAAAAGRPVVTTDVPGCRDAVIPGETGLLVPPRDPEALAEAIARLVGDPELRARMGAAGRRLAEERFGIDRIAARHLAVYAELALT